MRSLKAVKCKQCGHGVKLAGRIDPEGFSVTQGWEGMRDHWELQHPKEFERIQAALDEYYGIS